MGSKGAGNLTLRKAVEALKSILLPCCSYEFARKEQMDALRSMPSLKMIGDN